jgi:hypothetical protein
MNPLPLPPLPELIQLLRETLPWLAPGMLLLLAAKHLRHPLIRLAVAMPLLLLTLYPWTLPPLPPLPQSPLR